MKLSRRSTCQQARRFGDGGQRRRAAQGSRGLTFRDRQYLLLRLLPRQTQHQLHAGCLAGCRHSWAAVVRWRAGNGQCLPPAAGLALCVGAEYSGEVREFG